KQRKMNTDNVLRVKLLSFTNVSNKPLTHVVFQIKKLRRVHYTDSKDVLEEMDHSSTIILSLNNTFNCYLNADSYYQIIILKLCSKTKSKVIDYLILSKDYLLHLAHDNTHQSIHFGWGFNLEFSLEFVYGLSQKQSLSIAGANTMLSKKPTRLICRTIMHHDMILKQFYYPVFCSICTRFMWGLDPHGYQCTMCNLVTHKGCAEKIPFNCVRSPFIQSNTQGLKVKIPHMFQQHEPPLIRSLITSDLGHCNHCGFQILQNALKCTQCGFTIHHHCQSLLPSMCGFPYKSFAHVIGLILPAQQPNLHSLNRHISSSFDRSWLEPLPVIPHGIITPKLEDFKLSEKLGDGPHAKVFRVEHVQSKKILAIKVVDGKNAEGRNQIEVEKVILFRYANDNPYIVKAYCTFHKDSNLFLVMEYIAGKTLSHKMVSSFLSEDQIRFYVAELAFILQYLHSKNIVYRDLKLDHTIVDESGHICLIDFGLCRILRNVDEKCTSICGTPGYMAPEILDSKGYSFPVDFWSLGIILLQMLCGEEIYSPTDDNDNPIDFGEFFKQNPFLKPITPEAQSCLTALLEIDPEKRLGSPTSPHGLLRKHSFFNTGTIINWDEIEQKTFKLKTKTPQVH
ncbi:unnamed protein product, partial [Didymodactylos carnosus]